MYLSNQQRALRERQYQNQLEDNAEETQLKLYKELAKETADEEQATVLAEMAARVAHKVAEPSTKVKDTSLSKLFTAISSGKLNEFVKSMANVPSSGLSATAKVVQGVLEDAKYKADVNKKLSTIITQQQATGDLHSAVSKTLISELQKNSKFLQRMNNQGLETTYENVKGAFGELSEDAGSDLSGLPSQAPDVAIKSDLMSRSEFNSLKKDGLIAFLNKSNIPVEGDTVDHIRRNARANPLFDKAVAPDLRTLQKAKVIIEDQT